ncbi:NUDIX hydrolase [Pseudomonas fluorescens]|uniref:NUDIX hydrolase n=1 Tax=Pseudomonas fluorescens TaxID=294 RepID=UPI0009366911|nr:NUDIX domain-containing protein [Pseudomonas fluorescens]
MTTIGVFASVFNQSGEVLCVRRNYPPYGWTTPGGRLEDNETPEQGVTREVYEETGYQVLVERLVGIYYASHKSDLVISYECSIVGNDPWLADGEIAEIGFFAIHALPTPMRKNSQVRIFDAASGARGVSRTFNSSDHGEL